jgi:xanthosine utilization system XapX-like protein
MVLKLLYKPFAIVFGLIGGLLAKQIFRALWRVVDEEPPPEPDTRDAPLPKVLGAAALQSSTFAVTRAAVDRAGARTFESLMGAWPGKEREAEDER